MSDKLPDGVEPAPKTSDMTGKFQFIDMETGRTEDLTLIRGKMVKLGGDDTKRTNKGGNPKGTKPK